tara:strand:+ start:811 stop:1137 length:327 start_codon:yes stop_codon:yes gene_type:complete
MEIKKKVISFLGKAKPVVKGTKTLLQKISKVISNFGIWILSLFEKHQELRVRYNQFNVEGEIIDTMVRKFEVRKMYKCTPKHMKFKIMNGNKVELKTSNPMDYILEDL